jgi:hypothetical protein
MQQLLAPILVEKLIQSATEYPVGGPETDQICNTFVTLASSDDQNISGILFAKMRQSLSACNVMQLTEYALWKEICLGTRFMLHVSFNDVNQHVFLPDIFHILSLIVGLGPRIIRRNVYSTLLNILQKLLSDPSIGESQRSVMEISLHKFSDQKFYKLFGIDGSCKLEEAPAFFKGHDALSGEVVSSITMQEAQYFVSILSDIVTEGASDERNDI